MLVVNENEHPMSLQLFGHDIETMVYAAKVLDKQTNCDIIDINMGCPVTKVIKAQAGSSPRCDEGQPECQCKLEQIPCFRPRSSACKRGQTCFFRYI